MKKEYPMYPIHTDMINLMCNNTGPTLRERISYSWAIIMLVFTSPAERPFYSIARTVRRLITSKW